MLLSNTCGRSSAAASTALPAVHHQVLVRGHSYATLLLVRLWCRQSPSIFALCICCRYHRCCGSQVQSHEAVLPATRALMIRSCFRILLCSLRRHRSAARYERGVWQTRQRQYGSNAAFGQCLLCRRHCCSMLVSCRGLQATRTDGPLVVKLQWATR
jgi:hypothetical protein